MDSKVSGFLKEVIAPEIQNGMLGPHLVRSFPASFPLMTAINKAHVLMLERQGIIGRDVAGQLARVILELEGEGPRAVELDPAREDPYFNYEAEVVRRLGHDVGGRMHIARSRNDLKSTQDRLRARAATLDILEETLRIRQALIGRAKRFLDCVMPGYTHLQPAQPITFGWYLSGIESGLQRDSHRLLDAYGRLNLCPLGAGAIAGTSFRIDRRMVADLLGFDAPVPHAQDAVACRDAIMEILSACSFLMTTIGRMAQDFYVMTTYEFGTIDLPDRVAITSSIMPQKKNMAALENLKGRPAHLVGALMTAFMAYRATPYSHAQDGSFDSMRWAWDALEDLVLALPVARVVVEAAEPKRERMLELVRANFSTATDLADLLVREAGLSFRDAHHVVGRVVRLAMEDGLTADQVTRAMVMKAAQQTIGRDVGLSEEQVRTALDPVQCVDSRQGSGGPSRNDAEALIEAAEDRLAQDRERVAGLRRRVVSAAAELDEKFRGLAADPVPA